MKACAVMSSTPQHKRLAAVMESALSVAAAAVQFVQFSSQIISKGVPEENDATERVTLRLRKLMQRVANVCVTTLTKPACAQQCSDRFEQSGLGRVG
jgi:hypothetical protein